MKVNLRKFAYFLFDFPMEIYEDRRRPCVMSYRGNLKKNFNLPTD